MDKELREVDAAGRITPAMVYSILKSARYGSWNCEVYQYKTTSPYADLALMSRRGPNSYEYASIDMKQGLFKAQAFTNIGPIRTELFQATYQYESKNAPFILVSLEHRSEKVEIQLYERQSDGYFSIDIGGFRIPSTITQDEIVGIFGQSDPLFSAMHTTDRP